MKKLDDEIKKEGSIMEENKNCIAFYLKLIFLILCFIPVSILLFFLDGMIKLLSWMIRKKEEKEANGEDGLL